MEAHTSPLFSTWCPFCFCGGWDWYYWPYHNHYFNPPIFPKPF